MSPRFGSPKDGAWNPRSKAPEHNPTGTNLPEDAPPASTPEEIATAEREREQLLTLVRQAPAEPASGQAPAGAPAYQRAQPEKEPFIPAPAVDVEGLTKARQARLAEIDAKGRKVRELAVELETQERNAAELVKTMKAERQALLQQKEEIEREAIKIQQEITRADALAAAASLEQATADRQVLVLDERAAWKDKLKTLLRPLVERAQRELHELQVVQGGSSEIFGRAAAFRVPLELSQIGDGGQLYHSLDAACEACHRIDEETKASIAQCHRALGAARRILEHLPPDTADGRLMISRVTTDLGYCRDHAENARQRTNEAMSQFTAATKQAAPYLKTVKPVRPDVIVSLSGEDREAMQRRILSKSLPPQQTHAAGMNTDPLA
jgi:DNA repair exonuclease SbcCD ATPase subunit